MRLPWRCVPTGEADGAASRQPRPRPATDPPPGNAAPDGSGHQVRGRQRQSAPNRRHELQVPAASAAAVTDFGNASPALSTITRTATNGSRASPPPARRRRSPCPLPPRRSRETLRPCRRRSRPPAPRSRASRYRQELARGRRHSTARATAARSAMRLPVAGDDFSRAAALCRRSERDPAPRPYPSSRERAAPASTRACARGPPRRCPCRTHTSLPSASAATDPVRRVAGPEMSRLRLQSADDANDVRRQ